MIPSIPRRGFCIKYATTQFKKLFGSLTNNPSARQPIAVLVTLDKISITGSEAITGYDPGL